MLAVYSLWLLAQAALVVPASPAGFGSTAAARAARPLMAANGGRRAQLGALGAGLTALVSSSQAALADSVFERSRCSAKLAQRASWRARVVAE